MKETAILLTFEGELTDEEIAHIVTAARNSTEHDMISATSKKYDPEWGGVCIYQP